MSSKVNTFIQGDTLSAVKFRIIDSKTKQTKLLDGIFTAQLVWAIDDAAAQSKAMTVLSGADDGFVEYQFEAGELLPGSMQMRVKLTEIASGRIATTTNEVKKTVGAAL